MTELSNPAHVILYSEEDKKRTSNNKTVGEYRKDFLSNAQKNYDVFIYEEFMDHIHESGHEPLIQDDHAF